MRSFAVVDRCAWTLLGRSEVVLLRFKPFSFDPGSFVVFFDVLVGYAVFGTGGVCRSMSSNSSG